MTLIDSINRAISILNAVSETFGSDHHEDIGNLVTAKFLLMSMEIGKGMGYLYFDKNEVCFNGFLQAPDYHVYPNTAKEQLRILEADKPSEVHKK